MLKMVPFFRRETLQTSRRGFATKNEGTARMDTEELSRRLANCARNKDAELDLSDCGLTSLPESIGQLTSLTKLDLSRNQLTSLPPQIGQLAQLQVLYVQDNRLDVVPRELGLLRFLSRLSLSSNRLRDFAAESGTYRGLTRLWLDNNEFVSLPVGVCHFKNLRLLDLSKNGIQVIPANIGLFSDTLDLKLEHNPLESPWAELKSEGTGSILAYARIQQLVMGSQSETTSIDLSGKGLTRLPEEITRLRDLEDLLLADNKLHSLPSELATLTKLRRVNLAANRFTEVPDAVLGLTGLSELNLSGNQLQTLPEDIGRLDKLSTLSLDQNELATLPVQIRKLTQLRTLNVQSNRLSYLPSLERCVSLHSLYLNDNALTGLPNLCPHVRRIEANRNQINALPDAVGRLSDLNALMVSHNSLDLLPGTFSELHNLEVLDVSHNCLTRLPEHIGDCGKLRRLIADHNRLIDLPSALNGLSSIEELSLSDNRLCVLPTAINTLTTLTSLNIADNQIEALPDLSALGLRTLDASNNSIRRLPAQLAGLVESAQVGLANNPLDPPLLQIAMQGKGSLVAYLRAQLKIQKAVRDNASTLSLSGKHLSFLPDEICELSQLGSLDLSDNELEQLPNGIGMLENLTVLSLRNNRLAFLPPALFQLSKLRELDVSNNLVSTLSPALGDLSDLEILRLQSNSIVELPTTLGNLQRLQELDIANNKLERIGPEVGTCTALLILDVSANALRHLPEELCALPDLETIACSRNRLECLPSAIGGLQQLRHLKISTNALPKLPPELGRLRRLRLLDASDNRLTNLPSELAYLARETTVSLTDNPFKPPLAQLVEGDTVELLDYLEMIRTIQDCAAAGQQALDLSNRGIAILPPEIGLLSKLITLELNGNRLTSLPVEVTQLKQLAALDLRDNFLADFPPGISRISSLQNLNLSHNRISTLPEEISNLSHLCSLDLSENPISALPDGLFQLDALRSLNLSKTELGHVPDELGRLTELSELSLRATGLSDLPSGMFQLTGLVSLDLAENSLTSLPHRIGNFVELETLTISNNQLTHVPATIENAVGLRLIDFSHNKLTQVPATLGNLAQLIRLDVSHNRLRELPREWGLLPDAVNLLLQGNPLARPLPELVERGGRAVLTYLRSLTEHVALYEAKLLFVGEGSVGKTSLLEALLDRPFVKNRPTTHGMNVKSLVLRHPRYELDITLNAWDFGGQEVYRATRQFFFSNRSLYILVWKPREGQDENALEEWLRWIRLRVNRDVRVIVVATHCDERQPELDYPFLLSKFTSLLVGNMAVDSQSRNGMSELKLEIAGHASMLPQMGEVFSQRWIDAREEILALPEAVISRSQFDGICRTNDLDAQETDTLAHLLHDLGHIVHYQDDGLKDVVVLKPAWLTAAIGYILEDKQIRTSSGQLEHSRINAIWYADVPPELDRYEAKYHPYFLRLMEKYDICYRIPDAQRSLVAQLVPYERPRLDWERTTARREGERELSIVCKMDETPPGLIAWLTVRHHRFSTGLQWRRGVFLQYQAHGALIELEKNNDVCITVRGSSPEHFMSLLRDGLEYLIFLRWPGLAYELSVPCPTREANGQWCPGRFRLEFLRTARASANRYLEKQTCQHCVRALDVSELLTGFEPQNVAFHEKFRELGSRLERVVQGQELLLDYAVQNEQQQRRLLREVSAEAVDCPRMFVFAPCDTTNLTVAKQFERQGVVNYKLRLVCEHAGRKHICDGAGYTFEKPTEWLVRIAPWASLVAKALRVGLRISSTALDSAVTKDIAADVRTDLDFMEAVEEMLLCGELDNRGIAPATSILARQGVPLTSSEAAGLQELRSLLIELDKQRSWSGLRSVRTSAGDELWVCEHHYVEYDPGLPQLPFGEFDVFLSHNSKDKPLVRQLAAGLQDRGLKVWLDEWELMPGRPWQEALEKIIETTKSAAVLIGSEGIGSWEDPEMRACLSEFVSRDLPVIPVLLPGAPSAAQVPLFLRGFTLVDLRAGMLDAGMEHLIWGITGRKAK